MNLFVVCNLFKGKARLGGGKTSFMSSKLRAVLVQSRWWVDWLTTPQHQLMAGKSQPRQWVGWLTAPQHHSQLLLVAETVPPYPQLLAPGVWQTRVDVAQCCWAESENILRIRNRNYQFNKYWLYSGPRLEAARMNKKITSATIEKDFLS